MAGLASAWMLSQEGFRVTVFEKGPLPGLSAHSRDFSQFNPEATNELPGDVPSRMFNESLWPSVTEIYREAGIEFEPVDHQQTFFQNDDVLLKIGLPYSTTVLKNVFNPVARRLIGSLAAFQKTGLAELESGEAKNQTFGEFVDRHFHESSFREFLDCFLFPALTSTVFTCPKNDLRNYPCHLVLDALRRITGDGNLMRTVRGSDHAAKSLLSNIKDVRFNTAVKQVSSGPESATVHTECESFEFDHVVVATQANHASQIVARDLAEESALLKQFRYVDVPISVHTDSSILPANKSAWGTFNFDSTDSETATCTVWMNRFHPTWPKSVDVFHSIFPSDVIKAEHILFSTTMQRPVVDVDSSGLISEIERLHCEPRRVWFAGSYASAGVPLLESAVVSGRAVVEKMIAQCHKSPLESSAGTLS